MSFECEADQDFISQDGAIQKIKWLRQRTGMSLLAAKTLYDGLNFLANPGKYQTSTEIDRARALLEKKPNPKKALHERANRIIDGVITGAYTKEEAIAAVQDYLDYESPIA